MSVIYIHAGLHKTGSSSLQHFCRSNPRIMSRLNLQYSGLGENHSGPVVSAFSDNPVKFHYYRKHKGFSFSNIICQNRIIINQLRSELLSLPEGFDYLMSGEEISFLKSSELFRLKGFFSDFFKVKLITVYRDPFEYFKSSIYQHLKAGRTLAAVSARPPRLPHRDFYNLAYSVFGSDSISLEYNKAAGIIPHFFGSIGRRAESFDSNFINRNVSLPLEAMFLVNSLNTIGCSDIDYSVFPPGMKFELSRDLLECFKKKYMDDVSWYYEEIATRSEPDDEIMKLKFNGGWEVPSDFGFKVKCFLERPCNLMLAKLQNSLFKLDIDPDLVELIQSYLNRINEKFDGETFKNDRG